MSTDNPNSLWLLDGLGAEDLFYASPLLQQRANASSFKVKAYDAVSASLINKLFAQAHQQEVAEPRLFGLIPFDTRQPASFTVAQHCLSASLPQESPRISEQAKQTNRIVRQEPVPAPEHYADAVRAALKLYAQGQVKKIVLSRAMDVYLEQPLEQQRVLADLLVRNRQGYTFALPAWSEDLSRAGTMLAASPELLVRRVGNQVFINPLAGSIGRHSDPAIDTARREGLAVSEKDLREHSYVVNDIVTHLKPFVSELTVPDGPSVIGTDALWHLSTYITGQLKSQDTTALDLALALHPTPAICGHPTDLAFQHIKQLEAFDRDYFAGLAGWQTENGDGEWVLSLRCAFSDMKNRLRVYAGAGTVAGSDPDSETLETATKMETFLRALR